MAKTRIDWCDWVWNPVWGCLHRCNFCYARKLAKRFGRQMAEWEWRERTQTNTDTWVSKKDLAERLTAYKPTFLWHNYRKSFPKKPCRIFVNSISDPAFWEKEWIDLVLQRIKATPEHHFLFLSKAPESYFRFVEVSNREPFLPANVWLGATVLNNKQLIQFQNTLFALKGYGVKIIFVSLEPLLEPISPHLLDTPIDWIIIGAQTNPYRPPKREWVEEIVEFASDVNIPVFLKENLGPVWGDNLIREFPF